MSRGRLLLTGAAGFVGSHVLRHVLTQTDWDVVCPVTFRHRGLPDRLAHALGLACDRHEACAPDPSWQQRVRVVYTDMRAMPGDLSPLLAELGEVDWIWNVAAESHVDRSISDPVPFVRSNTDLALAIGELARRLQPALLLHMSTDEVYGPAGAEQFHREWDAIRPSNPYAASKACQEAILHSYWRTYGVPLVLTNTMNILGETQDPEKYMPRVLQSVLGGRTLTVHADLSDAARPLIGSRCWLHARNLADAWLWITQALDAQHYPEHTEPVRLHVVGEELDNLALAQSVADAAAAPLQYVLEDFHASRPGHDLRYALDGTAIAELGWKAPVTLGEGIERVVRWTVDHPEWLGTPDA